MHTHVHAHTYTHVREFTQTCTCPCAHMHTRVCTHTHMIQFKTFFNLMHAGLFYELDVVWKQRVSTFQSISLGLNNRLF